VPQLNNLTERVFRRNPEYCFQALDSLSIPAFKELVSRPGVAGVLRGTAGETKIAGAEVAALYGSLAQPSRLSPPLLYEISRRTAENVVLAALVLDKVIELESDVGFVSGAKAHSVVFQSRTAYESYDPVSRLSIAALKYGQALQLPDSYSLAGRLYCFNRRPASAAWKSRLPSRRAVAQYLGEANRDWTRTSSEFERPEWLIWHSKAEPRESREGPQHKLYISPEPGYLREAWQAALPVLGAFGAHTFKTGADLYGILRPDKFVAYFSSRERMHEAAKHIAAKLCGIPAQGVPFTGSLDGSGLVSWGMDPPHHAAIFPWSGRSWRCWLVDRLAAALVTAGNDSESVAAWEFALDRLSLDGVDTSSWEPDAALWRSQEQSA
jgi:hypothetical protein